LKTNILVATFGSQWLIVPELLGFTNHDTLDVYRNRADFDRILEEGCRFGIAPVSELWLVSTDDESTAKAVCDVREWMRRATPGVRLRTAILAGVPDLENAAQSRQMRDLVFRAVLMAHEAADGGGVFLSLAGGRKTMSGDIQEAGTVFGCSAMLHVLSRLYGRNLPNYAPGDFTSLSTEEAAAITPVAVFGARTRAAYLYGHDEVCPAAFPVSLGDSESGGAGRNPPETSLIERVESLSKRAGIVLSNFSAATAMNERGETFRSLMGLHPETIRWLQEEKIGVRREDGAADLDWIRAMPKAELHCHFGGILTPGQMVRVSLSEKDRVEAALSGSPPFRNWLSNLESLRRGRQWEALRKICASKAAFRSPVPGIPAPIPICAFLGLFADDVPALDELVFGPYRGESSFCAIGIQAYESLGDFQGSGLLQSESCIRAACQCLRERCRESNILYCEVRCSPANYARGGLDESEVVRIMLDELADGDDVRFSFIFIASRHGDAALVDRTVDLVQRLRSDPPPAGWSGAEVDDFRKRFAGFDLAGEEGRAKASDFREKFDKLLRSCVKMTIHAGETEPAESIWDAVYGLNADRIGHGLTLEENPDLLDKFLDRNIAVEMCPSSNYQIRGYQDAWVPESKGRPFYPLAGYLDRGLCVTVNTDDPGISRTTLDREYLKAARMTPGGLSKWQILKLMHNGFAASFASYERRRGLLREAGRRILETFENGDDIQP
jgi:adenosine deaminase